MRGFGGFVLVCVLVFVGLAVWWLESRFGANVAMMVLGGLVGVICFSAGGLLVAAITRSTLNSAAQFNHDIAGVERYRQQGFKELMRGDSAERRARSSIEVLDARRIDQLAQQRAALLLELERRRIEEEQRRQIPQWGVDDDDGKFSEWE